MRTAILWLTHFGDPEADEAFERLRFEACAWGDVLHVRHLGEHAMRHPGRVRPDVEVTSADLSKILPGRFAEATKSGLGISQGYGDILRYGLMEQLSAYERVWFIEYDVDYSGHWSSFFSGFDGCDADLLGPVLCPRRLCPGWDHWPGFVSPAGVDGRAHTRGFLPVLRLSRSFALAYGDEIGRGWSGHFEAIMPTMALHRRLRVEDIGGDGVFTPPQRHGLFYTSGHDPTLTAGTFRYRPSVADHYHHRLARLPANQLWHPVKTRAYPGSEAGAGAARRPI